MISIRQVDILKKIINDEEVNLNTLARLFEISKRMIHYDITNINFYLSKNNFETVKKSL